MGMIFGPPLFPRKPNDPTNNIYDTVGSLGFVKYGYKDNGNYWVFLENYWQLFEEKLGIFW